MIKYLTLATDDGSYKIETVFLNNGTRVTAFSILLDGKVVDIWDHEGYLINNLYPYLSDDIDNMHDKDEYDDFEDEFSNVKEDIKELFDEAIKLKLIDV